MALASFKKFLSPSEVEIRRVEQIQGVGAETMLRVLSPVMERRVEELLRRLLQAPPELNILLDIRAQLSEAWRIQKELKAVQLNGKEASEALGEIFNSVQ